MSTVTFSQLAAQMKAIGICPGDILLVHSSLRAIGPVEGGAATVLAALREALGPEGTLLMPSFPSGLEYDFATSGYTFDVRNTPSGCGYLTEYFRNQPGVIRSWSPTHSLAAEGPLAATLLQDHEKCSVTAGKGSPFQKLIEHHGKILMLGPTRHSNTTMHYLENTGGAPTLSCRCFTTHVITPDGKTIDTPIYPHLPGVNRNYPKAIDLLNEVGGLSAGPIGNATCDLYDAWKLRNVVYDALRENPCAFIRIFTP